MARYCSLARRDGVEIHRKEHAAHGADHGAGDAAAEAAKRGRDPEWQLRLQICAKRAGERIEPIQQDGDAKPPGQRLGGQVGEDVKPDRDTDHAARNELHHLVPGDVLAVLAHQRNAGDDTGQCPGRHEDLQRDDEGEQRHRHGRAEARRAARHVGGDHHDEAVDKGEGGKRLDGRNSRTAATLFAGPALVAGFPDDELILVNYEHHAVDSPYRMRFAILCAKARSRSTKSTRCHSSSVCGNWRCAPSTPTE